MEFVNEKGRMSFENCHRSTMEMFRKKRMVGAVRFELTTSCTRNKRATRLRYAPTQIIEENALLRAAHPAIVSNLLRTRFR